MRSLKVWIHTIITSNIALCTKKLRSKNFQILRVTSRDIFIISLHATMSSKQSRWILEDHPLKSLKSRKNSRAPHSHGLFIAYKWGLYGYHLQVLWSSKQEHLPSQKFHSQKSQVTNKPGVTGFGWIICWRNRGGRFKYIYIYIYMYIYIYAWHLVMALWNVILNHVQQLKRSNPFWGSENRWTPWISFKSFTCLRELW